MIRLLTAWTRITVVAVSMAVSIPAIMFAQTTESATESVPVEAEDVEVNTRPMGDDAFVETAPFARSEIPVDINVGSQSRFNDLRRELLDDRAKLVDWWLAALAVILGFFAIVAVVGGYIAFARFREIEAEARKSVEAAKRYEADAKDHAERIEALQGNAVADVQRIRDLMTAEVAAQNPAEANQAVKDARENPEASLTDKAIADAVSLQQQGKRADAIEKWRAIAHVVEGSDNDLAARAWFSVGYLALDEDPKGSVLANDRAIRLKPDLAGAYSNRGNAKHALGRHEDAIADYDEAIHLNPTLVEAYSNRGVAKAELGQYEDAVDDCNEAIRLKPDYAEAYINRGAAKVALVLKDAARKDFEIALELARKANDAKIVAQAEQLLRDLDAAEGS